VKINKVGISQNARLGSTQSKDPGRVLFVIPSFLHQGNTILHAKSQEVVREGMFFCETVLEETFLISSWAFELKSHRL
jgi:hypothetical protein